MHQTPLTYASSNYHQILVREWNPQIEDLRDESDLDPVQVERIRSSKAENYLLIVSQLTTAYRYQKL